MVSNNRLKNFLVADELHNYVEKQSPLFNSNNAIEVQNATLSWNIPNDMTNVSLWNLDFEIPKRGLVVVVGTVGSGKSSLLMALLGKCSHENQI